MKAIDKHPYYVGIASLSVFGGNFILAKVHWGLNKVSYLELRSVYFLEARNVLALCGQVSHPLYRGCPGPLLDVLP